MTDPRQDDALVRAFELIEEERLPEARELIQSVLDEDEHNADAWWIYAHAVEDRTEVVRALNQVASIDPNYDGLNELLAYYTDEDLPEIDDIIEPEKNIVSDELDSFDDDIDFDDDFDQITQQPVIAEYRENVWPRRIVIITVILLLAMVGYLIWSSSRADSTDADTEVVVVPTEDSVILLPDNAEELILEEPTVEAVDIDEIPDGGLPANEISLILGDYQLANDEFIYVDSALGRTQIISLCNDENESLRDTIQNALLAFSNNLGLIELDSEAIAIRISSCDTNEILSFIGVSVDDVTFYNAGELTDSEFIGAWAVLD